MMRLAKVGNAYKKPDPMEQEEEDTEEMKLEPDALIDLLIEHPDITLEAVKEGMETEREHTECPCIRAKITMDHLLEDPEYYEKLEKMEGETDNEKDE